VLCATFLLFPSFPSNQKSGNPLLLILLASPAPQAWAHPQCFGRLLATFSAYETTIHLWQLEHGCVLAFQKSLPGGNRGVRNLSFAPVDQGPWLAAACADGIVRTYSPFDPVDHSTWEAGTRLPAAPPHGCCHSVTWAEPSTLQAPLLAVITTDQNGSRYAAHVFAHSRSFLRWISWCTLAEEVERTLQFVAFASNTSNASYERAAIGVGNRVYIMRLSEDAKEVAMADDENKASVQEIARIELEDEVEDASWSHDSMKLAVRTMCGSVAVYTQSLLDESEWRKVQSIA